MHRFMSFLWNHDSGFYKTRTASFVSLTRDLINVTGSNRNVNLKEDDDRERERKKKRVKFA